MDSALHLKCSPQAGKGQTASEATGYHSMKAPALFLQASIYAYILLRRADQSNVMNLAFYMR